MSTTVPIIKKKKVNDLGVLMANNCLLEDHINKVVEYCKIFQYADDTVILFAGKNVANIEYALSADLKSIGSYCVTNELLLNLKTGKTESKLFGSAQGLSRHGGNLNIIYENTPINFVTEYVYLGNLLDNHMSLTKNFDRSYKKACGRLRLFSYVRSNVTTATAVLIYKMMIVPLLTYSSTMKTTFTNTQLLKFASVDRCAKVIIQNPPMKCVKEIVLVLKCVRHEFDHIALNQYFESQNHNKHTRNNKFSPKLPTIKLEIARPNFYFRRAKLFNNLPLEIRKTIST